MIWTNLTIFLLGTLPSAREGHGFILGPDNKFYVFGGKSNAGENSIIVFLLFQIQIGPLLNMLILMLNCGYFLLFQKVMWPVLWVLISQSNDFLFCFLSGLLNDLYCFDPEQYTWNLSVQNDSGVLPAARWFHGFTEANGILFLFGGLGNSGRHKD
jgi:hypothetical protein